MIEIENVIRAFQIGAGFNWSGAIEVFRSQDFQARVVEGLVAAETIASVVGVFLPPAAIVASDLSVFISVEEFVEPLVAPEVPAVVASITHAWNWVRGRLGAAPSPSRSARAPRVLHRIVVNFR